MKEALQDISILRAAERQRDEDHASELVSLRRANEKLMAKNSSNSEVLKRLQDILLSRHAIDASHDSYSVYNHLELYMKQTEGAAKRAQTEIDSLSFKLQGKQH